jgi:hypothetical protein
LCLHWPVIIFSVGVPFPLTNLHIHIIGNMNEYYGEKKKVMIAAAVAAAGKQNLPSQPLDIL